MKSQQQQEARELYLSTDMTKTEIAEAIGVHRSTVHLWVSQGEWSRMKYCARHLPSLISEKCYFILGDLADSILDRQKRADVKDAETIYKLISGINKLKARTTSNEGMEMFTHFMEKLSGKDPQLARSLRPHIAEYMTARKSIKYTELPRQEESPFKELPMTEKNIIEHRLDETDYDKWAQERYTPELEQQIVDQQQAMKEFLAKWKAAALKQEAQEKEAKKQENKQENKNEEENKEANETAEKRQTPQPPLENKTLHPSTDYQALAS